MHRREFLGAVALMLGCRTAGTDRAPPREPHASAPPAEEPDEVVLDEGRSEFNHVIVTEQGAIRRLYFENDGRRMLQTTYDLTRPGTLHHPVFQTMLAGLLVQPSPRRMCMIGLGGGQLSNHLYKQLPELDIEVVEICPEVVRLAKKWFDVPDDDPRYRVHVADGRVFVEGLAPHSVDLLIHDAYRGLSIPRHLRSQEFFAACAERLTPEGVLLANMHRRTARYPVDRATMAAVFRHVYRFSSFDDVQTTVVMSMRDEALTLEQLAATAERLQPRFSVDLRGLAGRCLIDEDDWDPARVIHDDFDPGELDDAAREHNLSCTPHCDGDEAI